MEICMFRKKWRGVLNPCLSETDTCIVWEGIADECDPRFHIICNADFTNLLYINGKLTSFRIPDGGICYPFAKNPKIGGSISARKGDRAELVTVPRNYYLNVPWMIPDIRIADSKNEDTYTVGVSGRFYYRTDGSDETADRLYCRFFRGQTNANEKFMDFLRARFQEMAELYLREILGECLTVEDVSDFGLLPSEILRMSKLLYEKIKDVFEPYGILLDPFLNESGMLMAVVVKRI